MDRRQKPCYDISSAGFQPVESKIKCTNISSTVFGPKSHKFAPAKITIYMVPVLPNLLDIFDRQHYVYIIHIS